MLEKKKLRGGFLLGLAFLSFTWTSLGRAQVITDMSDITNWVGTGTNSSALVISWNDGVSPVSLAWGFHWDGVATGEQMLEAIAGATYNSIDGDVTPPLQILTGADGNLTLYVTSFSFGDAVSEIAYQNGSVSHAQGVTSGFPPDGFWEYFAVGGEFDTPTGANTDEGTSAYPGTGGTPDWTVSFSGFDSRDLANNSWDGWSYNTSTDGSDTPPLPPIAAPVPEVSTCGLTTLGLLPLALALYARRRRIYLS